jgi:hypothetical protein
MFDHELRYDEEILVLSPNGPLDASDFTELADRVEAYLRRGRLRGVLIRAKSFPGWKNFGALLAHLKFVREHLQGVEKVAVVADGVVANTMPSITNHFMHAESRHFDLACEDAAWAWLRSSDGAGARLRQASGS